MKIKVVLCYMGLLCGIMMPSKDVFAVTRLAPRDFNKMYYLAAQGRVGILRSAVNRGLNIDTVNARGDTGLCVAVKRKNYVAYNSFKMSGANPKHPCTYRMHRQYQEFLAATKNAREKMIIGNKESLQYKEEERSWWPWILGGVAIGGAMSAFSGGGSSAAVDNTIIPVSADDGLSSIVTSHTKLVDNRTYSNGLSLDASNPNASSVVNKISFLPNIADNYNYLHSYISVKNGGYFENMADGRLIIGDRTIGKSGDGAIGVAVDGKNSVATNLGSIKIDAFNGAIGMAASDEGAVTNGDKFGDYITGVGNIDIIFTGSKEGNTVIGMYADTNSEAINYGTIKASTASAIENTDNVALDDVVEVAAEEGAEKEKVVSPNSGTILGMGVFDLYTGKDYSADEVIAKNYGLIDLTAGYNTATDVSVSLIGMGSYIDDKFLKGNSNPNFAEQMKLRNDGTINLSYQGAYKIGEGALKLGDGGLIGMRADAQSLAINAGDINIDMRATTIDSELDVAAGMLSVHGAELINNVNSKIHILNEATVGGVYYGMLAAKGDGSQTNLYKWKAPKLTNSGEIYMEASNSYGMASFAGGTLLNDGTIFLGVENGQSNYKNNYGMYADGSDKTEEVHLINEGLINVYSELSTAIYNAFSGSVYMENRGDIYISNKATGSKVFGGNYSALVNSGTISYSVGNSAEYVPVEGDEDKIGINVETEVLGSVIEVSGDSNTTKQTFTNTVGGSINVGDSWSSERDYGGTYVTSGIKISKQGSAYNKGTINLNLYENDIGQFNTGIWLDSTTTAEAFAENYGVINVGATNSIGIRNDSQNGGIARNFADINVTGTYGYGMSARSGASIFNGLSTQNADADINVVGDGSIGMYVEGNESTAFNYGKINLNGNSTTAFQLNGEGSRVENKGDITFTKGLDDITFFWMTNGASKEFVYEDGIIIDAYTLGKATDGGVAYFSANSVATVRGQNSHLFVAEGNNSDVYNKGKVDLDDAVAMIGRDGASVINVGNAAEIRIKDATSIGMEVTGSAVATNDSGATIDVSKGIGIKATEFSRANNFATMNVRDSGTGIYLLHGDGNNWTTGDNRGTISVKDENSKGVDVGVGAVFINKGTINVTSEDDGKAYGVYSNGNITTDRGSSINVGKNSYGIYAKSGGIDNSGNISVSTSDSYGIYSEGAPVNNIDGAIVNVSSGTGIYAASGTVTNGGIIEVTGDGVGIEGYVVNNNIINVSYGDGVGIRGDGVNDGDINATYAVGVDVKNKFINNLNIRGAAESDKGIVNVNSNARFDNNGNIIVSSGPGSGVLNNGGQVINNGTIDVLGAYGATVNGGTMISYGKINVSGSNSVGVRVVNGNVKNDGYGTIEVLGQGAKGLLIESGATGSNSGLIQVIGKRAIGVYVETGGSFTNSGTIEYASKDDAQACVGVTCGGQIVDTSEEAEQTSLTPNLVSIENGGEFINNGEVIYNDLDVNFDDIKGEDAAFVVGKGGVYTASSFEGEVKAGTDIVKGGFEDVYVNENSFVGENNGLNVTSKSYMFEATTNVKDGVTDVELNRKRFEDIVEEKQLAEFFEINYNLNHNEKMYDSLKSATNEKEFNAAVKDETGEKFYANLPRENIAVLRGLASNEQTRVLQDGLKEKTVGANFFRTGKDGDSGLSDYEDDVYSAYIGFGNKLSNNWSMGGTFMAGYADSSYDAGSDRENKILMAFMPILYQNDRFKYLATPHIGFGLGSYKRHAGSGDYEADTFDIYYGMSNHAEYSLDVKVAELVWEAELNMLGVKSDDMEEKDGFVLKSHDTLSLEAGLGVKLRKKIEFDKKRSLMLAVGTKYYQELLDPYEQLDKTIKGSPISLDAGRYDEDKQRLKTTIEALYKDGDMSVGAEISHNKEKKSNIEGGLGIRYNF